MIPLESRLHYTRNATDTAERELVCFCQTTRGGPKGAG